MFTNRILELALQGVRSAYIVLLAIVAVRAYNDSFQGRSGNLHLFLQGALRCLLSAPLEDMVCVMFGPRYELATI